MNNQLMEPYGHHPGLLELPIYSPAWTPSPSSRNILCWSSAIFSALGWLLLLLRWAAPWWSQLVHPERNQGPSWTYATQDTCWSIGGSLLRTDTPPFHKVLQTLSNSSPDHSLIRTKLAAQKEANGWLKNRFLMEPAVCQQRSSYLCREHSNATYACAAAPTPSL